MSVYLCLYVYIRIVFSKEVRETVPPQKIKIIKNDFFMNKRTKMEHIVLQNATFYYYRKWRLVENFLSGPPHPKILAYILI